MYFPEEITLKYCFWNVSDEMFLIKYAALCIVEQNLTELRIKPTSPICTVMNKLVKKGTQFHKYSVNNSKH